MLFRLNRIRSIHSTARSFSVNSLLVSRHELFLNTVRSHGSGDVVLKETSFLGIYSLTLSNISKMNAISGRMMFQLACHVDEITKLAKSSSASRIRGLIITGDGDAFCAGADFTLAKEVLTTPELGLAMSSFMTDALNTIRNSNVISVCLINGPAIGGGSELTTAGDFRLMKYGSYVKFVHAKMGVSPGWGAVNRLYSIVGRTQSLRLLGTSLPMYAEEATRIGFADSLTSEQSVDALRSAIEYLYPYTRDQSYPDAVACIKEAIVAADAMDLTQAKQVEMNMFGKRWGGADNKAALKSK